MQKYEGEDHRFEDFLNSLNQYPKMVGTFNNTDLNYFRTLGWCDKITKSKGLMITSEMKDTILKDKRLEKIFRKFVNN